MSDVNLKIKNTILFVLNKYKDYSYEPLSKISRNPYLTEEIAFKYFHEIGIDSILKTNSCNRNGMNDWVLSVLKELDKYKFEG